ncbi:MAG: hypothetical protein M5U12_27845 [Verrucomicrobia bacterium]|nr:hypothetical protein [Verrucomicrobiota bacterium]
MNAKHSLLTNRVPLHAVLLLVAGLTVGARGQAFVSGSDGSYGPLEITANTTLAMPADGVFHCTTITIRSGATLQFIPNARNTPVRLLATGDVLVSGTIDVSGANGTTLLGGAGGPGGFAGGNPGRLNLPPSAGAGPGGGPTNVDLALRHGVFGNRRADAPPELAQPYGNALLLPLIGGSGGGGSPSFSGGGGGGAILIASSTSIRVVSPGRILATGGYNSGSAGRGVGSGGAIRLVAPRVIGERVPPGLLGVLSVASGLGSSDASFGRIRIDTEDRTQLDFNLQPMAAVSIGSFMTLNPAPLPPSGLGAGCRAGHRG